LLRMKRGGLWQEVNMKSIRALTTLWEEKGIKGGKKMISLNERSRQKESDIAKLLVPEKRNGEKGESQVGGEERPVIVSAERGLKDAKRNFFFSPWENHGYRR